MNKVFLLHVEKGAGIVKTLKDLNIFSQNQTWVSKFNICGSEMRVQHFQKDLDPGPASEAQNGAFYRKNVNPLWILYHL